MVVLGIGIDMVKTEKFSSAIKKWGDAFLSRVFEEKELSGIPEGKMYYQRLAARFAAKEAVIKAVSKSFPLALKDIHVLNRSNGAPYCMFKDNMDLEIFLSITHIEDYAVACAVAQKKT
ncbi:MAG: 4'-phosphopantetheinyl transferase superfamily protein [Candidatus Omnitrophica bacterium]|nr:4'-phosphopantetheinyl transferase superfamily protein [Candidatus Omnitrophota bacterium]MBD3268685.1 4'-phosphopantetheinyl transferase superfamily protein [Candidatus Omnitrophota bacterium]